MTFKEQLLDALKDGTVVDAVQTALQLREVETRQIETTSHVPVETFNAKARVPVGEWKDVAPGRALMCLECRQNMLPGAPRFVTWEGVICMPCHQRTQGQTGE